MASSNSEKMIGSPPYEGAALSDSTSVRSLLHKLSTISLGSWEKTNVLTSKIGELIGCGKPALLGDLYGYLIGRPLCSNPEQQKQLVRRMREAMIKCIVLNGIPVVLLAFRALAALEKDEDKDHCFSRKNWQRDEVNRERGEAVMLFLYQKDFASMLIHFTARKDLLFLSNEICYGLFLANHEIRDLQKSELVILWAIMSQNLKGPSMWHLRGCRRAGVSAEDTELIQQAIELIAGFAGKSLDVDRVSDITAEMQSL